MKVKVEQLPITFRENFELFRSCIQVILNMKYKLYNLLRVQQFLKYLR